MNSTHTCVHCGAPLPEGANLCPFCAKSQLPPEYIAPPTGRRLAKRLLAVGTLLAIAAAIVIGALPHLTAVLRSSPQVYEGEAELRYTLDGVDYRLFLTFDSGRNPAPQSENSLQIRAGEQFANPSQLLIQTADRRDAAEAFLPAVSGCTVAAEPLDGAAAMDHTNPQRDESFPHAALTSHIFFDTTCGSNDICWTLELENGDTLRLRHRIAVDEIPVAVFSAADADLTTSAALEAFLQSLDETLEPGTLLELYLPPVVYTEPVDLGCRAVSLFGSSAAGVRSTFAAPVTAHPTDQKHMTIQGVAFAGQGGTGLSAATGVSLEECTFTGWDTAAEAVDGGWVGASGCTFEENGVGLRFDTTEAFFTTHAYPDNRWIRNEIALALYHMPGEEILTFEGSVFEGNNINVDNQTRHPLDFSGTTVS